MKYILISAIILITIFIIVLNFIPLGIEPLTELYFEDHTTLPKHIFLNKPYNYSFTIHNLEYQNTSYTYKVFSETTEFDSGEIILEHNQSITIPQIFQINKPFEKMKINIQITKNNSQLFTNKLWWPDPNSPTQIQIHLLIEEIVGTTITVIPD
ncbi:hypothetical protein ACFL0X_00625 [Nanoarchaeota archaeon]